MYVRLSSLVKTVLGWKFTRYGLVGILNMFLSFAIFNFFLWISDVTRGIEVTIFSAITFAIVVTHSFFWNKFLVFKSQGAGHHEYVKFFIVSTTTATVNVGIISLLVNGIGAPSGVDPLLWANIAVLITIPVSVLGNFTGYALLVFKQSARRKRVVVLGKGELAERVAQWFLENPAYELHCVVPNNPPSMWTSKLDEWARPRGVRIVESGQTNEIPPGSIDLAVSVTYDKIIKSDFIARCKRIINIHNGPLPKYRGVNPINWALKNNERQHGVTIHEITPGIDDGPIIAQRIFDITPEMDEVIDVYKRCLRNGWELFVQTMPHFWEIEPKPQDNSQATYYSAKDFPRLGERSNFTRKESSGV